MAWRFPAKSIWHGAGHGARLSRCLCASHPATGVQGSTSHGTERWWMSNCTPGRVESDCSFNHSELPKWASHWVVFADKQKHAKRQGHGASAVSLATSPLHSILPTHHRISLELAHSYTQLITRLLCFLQSLLADSVNGFHSLGSFTPACLVTHPWHVLQIEPVFVPHSVSRTHSLLHGEQIKPWSSSHDFFTVHLPSASVLIVFQGSTWLGTISKAK